MKPLANLLSFLIMTASVTLPASAQAGAGKSAQPHPMLTLLPVPSGLGVNIHFYQGTPLDWGLLIRAGVGIVRMDFTWARGEPRAGEYRFEDYDALLDSLRERRIRLLCILDYGNPNYDDGLAPKSDRGRSAWAKFARKLALRYRDRHIIWELWNEPNIAKFWRPEPDVEAYMKWAQLVTQAIRDANPVACIVGPATSRIDLEFLEDCFRRGLLDLVDAVSVHPYRGPDRSPETAIPEYEALEVLIERYRPPDKRIPILSGEWGYSCTWLDELTQAKYLVRQWLTNMALGIPVSIWYDWRDDGPNPEDPEHNFGTLRYNGTPKPAYEAMSALIRELGGLVPKGRIGLGSPNDYLVLFLRGGQIKLALWTTGDPHPVDLGPDLGIARAVGMLGETIPAPLPTHIVLTDSPIYLTVTAPPTWLQPFVRISGLNHRKAAGLAREIASGRRKPGSLAWQLLKALQGGGELERSASAAALLRLCQMLPPSAPGRVSLLRLILSAHPSSWEERRAIVELAKIDSAGKQSDLVLALQDQPELSSAVGLYAFQMAYCAAKNGQKKRAIDWLSMGLRNGALPYLAERVLDLLKPSDSLAVELAGQAGFICRWYVAGPFEPDTSERPRSVPEDPEELLKQTRYSSRSAKWRKVKANNPWGIVRFHELYGTEPGLALARAEIRVPTGREVMLKIGSNDGVSCWLNGKLLFDHEVARPLTVDQDQVGIRLKKGVNHLLFEVRNEGRSWELCVRVCTPQGKPIDVRNLTQQGN